MYKLNLLLKRAFDIISCSIAIVLLIPVWIVVSIAIKLDSNGPIFFKQGRRTKDGRVFQMLKFRSMCVGAEKQGTGLFSYDNDPRVTKVGAFLRRTSIDEFPQFFNVLIGDISLVGPRPCVTYELGDFDTLNNKYKKRFLVKGGITGLAQCKGRNENSWDEKVILDGQYVDLFRQEGVWIDIKILWWSFFKIFQSANINEEMIEGYSAKESAALSDEEIKRIAHLPEILNGNPNEID
jgi:lipopolysaccharide/colanic/teichoic acid biosynthesis glycosyltransferase